MPKTTTIAAVAANIPEGFRPYVVTTAHRGVFFGYAKPETVEAEPKNIRLQQARNCVYWAADLRGFLGLARSGPNAACKIGPAVDDLLLYDVTCVVHCTNEAATKWQSAQW